MLVLSALPPLETKMSYVIVIEAPYSQPKAYGPESDSVRAEQIRDQLVAEEEGRTGRVVWLNPLPHLCHPQAKD